MAVRTRGGASSSMAAPLRQAPMTLGRAASSMHLHQAAVLLKQQSGQLLGLTETLKFMQQILLTLQ